MDTIVERRKRKEDIVRGSKKEKKGERKRKNN
jgi:hypothetical protein